MLEVTNTQNIDGITKKDIFKSIVDDEKEKFDLDEAFQYPFTTALSRIDRSSLDANNNHSPMIFINK